MAIIDETSADLEAPPRRPLERYLLIQADQFCACGYNLHGQRVSHDERLGFPVVRCPECGKWHPAGHGSTALRPWLARLATVGLAIWMAVLLVLALAIAGALLGMQFGYMWMDATWTYIDAQSGRLFTQRVDENGNWGWAYADTGEPATPVNVMWQSVAVPVTSVPAGSVWGNEPAPRGPRIALILVAAALGLIGGSVQAAAMWHVRGLRQVLPMLLVLGLSAGVAWLIVFTMGIYYERVRLLFAWASLLMLGTALVGWCVGLLLGRPVFRVIVAGLIPPRPRMMLAFLWQADGKPIPAGE